MKFEYLAIHVGFDDDNEAMTVAFGGLPDADNSPTIWLMLQRSTNEDGQGIDGL